MLIVLEPILRSEARRVIGRYTPEELYSTKRDVIERAICEELKTKIDGRHMVLEAVLIRNIELPATIRDAIDRKLAAEQEVLKGSGTGRDLSQQLFTQPVAPLLLVARTIEPRSIYEARLSDDEVKARLKGREPLTR